jgi:ADP-ribose pyrophosphatase YjhB (NUDIX family)
MPLHLPEAFAFCPQCGCSAGDVGQNPFSCAGCGFRFYFGPTVAVGAIVTDDAGRVLLLRRARDPGRGKLGIPGGFVDVGEGVEEAMAREVFEETQLTVQSMRYIASFPNSYAYRGLLYPVTDVFFECHVDGYDQMVPQACEIEEFFFRHPSQQDLAEMAFESNRRAIEAFLEQAGR